MKNEKEIIKALLFFYTFLCNILHFYVNFMNLIAFMYISDCHKPLSGMVCSFKFISPSPYCFSKATFNIGQINSPKFGNHFSNLDVANEISVLMRFLSSSLLLATLSIFFCFFGLRVTYCPTVDCDELVAYNALFPNAVMYP